MASSESISIRNATEVPAASGAGWARVWMQAVVSLFVFEFACFLTYANGSPTLVTVSEAFASTLLMQAVALAWLSSSPLAVRFAQCTMVASTVFASMYFLLADSFASWCEVAIWFVPLTSLWSAVLTLNGWRLDFCAVPSDNVGRFSIRAIFLASVVVAIVLTLTRELGSLRKERDVFDMLWLIDALVLVVPVSLLGVSLTWATLRFRAVYVIALLVLAPASGVAICKIYGWSDMSSTVVFTSLTALLVTVSSATFAANGLRCVVATDLQSSRSSRD